MKQRLGLVITILAILGTSIACTPREVGLWKEWHAKDPVAAERFARNLNQTQSSGGDGWGTPGNCASYQDDMRAVGLPVQTFTAIAWRESGCNPYAWVVDNDDTGGGLFGFNFRGSLATYWRNLCGLTEWNTRGNVPLQMRCAKAAYNQLGLQPWAQ